MGTDLKNIVGVSLDYETYSECDLKTCGAWVYSEHPSTEVICMGYAYGRAEPELWLPGQPLPKFVQNPNQYPLHAWNSFFEYCIWHNTLKWSKVRMSMFYDTMAVAASMAFPLSLDKAGRAIGIPEDMQKLKRGRYLINKLCKPQRGVRIKDPDLLEELYEYCRQDVRAERHILEVLNDAQPK